MANLLYTNFFVGLADSSLDWDTDTIVALLERSTSAYTPAAEDTTVETSFEGAGGGVEISVASYSRLTLTNCATSRDAVNHRAKFTCNTLAFGALEAGQTVKSIIIAKDNGATNTLLARIDTVSGDPSLPAALAGGAFTLTLDAAGAIHLGQA